MGLSESIVAQIIAAILPKLLERLPELVDAIFNWLTNASKEQVVALGKNLGVMVKAAQSELA